MSTIDDVVKTAGVSRSTVFRFLAGHNVRLSAREAIQTAMKKLNYYYNPKHSRRNIVLVASVRDHFEGLTAYAEMVSGLMSRAEALGLTVRLHAGSGPALDDLRGTVKNHYGVIIIGKSDQEEAAEAAALKRLGVPHVFVNRVFSDLEFSFVSADLRKAAQEAVEHLLSLGHRDIGSWGRPGDYRIDRDKMAGYRDAYLKWGLNPPELQYRYESDGELEDIVRRLFANKVFPHAWFGLSDSHLMRLLPLIREYGLRIPEDIALVGMDDLEPSRFFMPPITSVHIPFREAGATAVDALVGLLENPKRVSTRIILKHELIVRESCGAKLRR